LLNEKFELLEEKERLNHLLKKKEIQEEHLKKKVQFHIDELSKICGLSGCPTYNND